MAYGLEFGGTHASSPFRGSDLVCSALHAPSPAPPAKERCRIALHAVKEALLMCGLSGGSRGAANGGATQLGEVNRGREPARIRETQHGGSAKESPEAPHDTGWGALRGLFGVDGRNGDAAGMPCPLGFSVSVSDLRVEGSGFEGRSDGVWVSVQEYRGHV